MNTINKRKDIALGDFSLEPSENFISIFLKTYVIMNVYQLQTVAAQTCFG